MIGMTKDEFVARMLEDAYRRIAEEVERKRRAKVDVGEYFAERSVRRQKRMKRYG